MKAIVQVVFEIGVDTDDADNYADIDVTDPPSMIAEAMVKFDVENFPEVLECKMPTGVTFKRWVK